MAYPDIVATARKALRIVSTSFDDEINRLCETAVRDLAIAGVTATLTDADPAKVNAIVTYVLLHFGAPANYEQLRRSYDEQKAQLVTDFAAGD